MADTRQKLGAIEKSLISFEDMADLPTFEAKRKALLARTREVYEIARVGRSYVDKKNAVHTQPDASAMVKCIELSGRLLGMQAEADKRVRDGDGESRGVEIDQLLSLLRSMGYKVEKAA